MIVTTSIAEGDSRAICLDQLIDAEDAVIVRVVPTMLWPGAATVTVGCLWLHKGSWSKPSFIDDRPVGRIGTDFRNESKQLSQFARLVLNTNRCWRGTEINGPGFVLTAEEAKELIRLNPKNGEILCKNLTGSDVNTSPTIKSGRWVINFQDWSRDRAEQFIDCFAIVTERVKPYRDKLTKQIHEADYWNFWDKRLAKYEQIRHREKVLVLSLVTKHVSFAFASTNQVFSHRVEVFTNCEHDAFAVLQSSLHFQWCWRFSPRNLSLLAYSPRSCFESFPFPNSDHVAGEWGHSTLRDMGGKYEFLPG